MIGLRALVLNADMAPISLMPVQAIPVEDAVTRCYNQGGATCVVVSEYDRPIKTPTAKLNWPSVVARTHYLKLDRNVALTSDNLYYRDHAVCAYCGVALKLPNVTVDHVIPRSKGGVTEWKNLVIACPTCNYAKSDALPRGEWQPRHRLYEPTYWNLLKVRKRFPLRIDHADWQPWIGEWTGPVEIRV